SVRCVPVSRQRAETAPRVVPSDIAERDCRTDVADPAFGDPGRGFDLAERSSGTQQADDLRQSRNRDRVALAPLVSDTFIRRLRIENPKLTFQLVVFLPD